MNNADLNEREFSHKIAGEFLGNGYQQVDHKSVQLDLPSGYIPDLIFRRGDEVVVIEIKSASEHIPLEHLRYLKEAVEQKPNWKFKLYSIPHRQVAHSLRENFEDVDRILKRARQLNRNGEIEAASVLLWMAIETALRTLLANRQSRPNPGVSGLSMARSLRLDPREPLSPDLIKLARSVAQKAQSESASAA